MVGVYIALTYTLKEECITFNAASDRAKAEELFDSVLNVFITSGIKEFDEFITLLTNWKKEIINSFTIISSKQEKN